MHYITKSPLHSSYCDGKTNGFPRHGPSKVLEKQNQSALYAILRNLKNVRREGEGLLDDNS